MLEVRSLQQARDDPITQKVEPIYCYNIGSLASWVHT